MDIDTFNFHLKLALDRKNDSTLVLDLPTTPDIHIAEAIRQTIIANVSEEVIQNTKKFHIYIDRHNPLLKAFVPESKCHTWKITGQYDTVGLVYSTKPQVILMELSPVSKHLRHGQIAISLPTLKTSQEKSKY